MKNSHVKILKKIPHTSQTSAIHGKIRESFVKRWARTLLYYTTQVWCWSKANQQELKAAVVPGNWTDVLNSEDVNYAWQTWKTRLLNIADRHIPKRLVLTNFPRHRPWMNGRLKQAIREKHRLFRTYKQNPTPHGWSMFKQQHNKVTSMLQTAKSDFIFTLASGEHQNSETSHSARDGEPAAALPQSHNLPRLYQFLTVFSNRKLSFTPPLLHHSGSLVEKDVEKAEILNAFFVTQASQSALDEEPPPINAAPLTEDSQLLVSFTISLSDVERALRVLNARKAPGFDGIPARLLVILKDEIVHCVHHIFTLSLTVLQELYLLTGSLPPWPQSTKNVETDKWLPTTGQPHFWVYFQSALKTLYSYLDQFLPIHQSGFRQRDSTAYQLARLEHRLATAGDEGNTTLACFYDLSKAFDRVLHKGLLAKLHHFGVRSHALAWITDYLSDRRQWVRIRNST